MRQIHRQKCTLAWLLLLLFTIVPKVHAVDFKNNAELEAFFDGALSIQLTKYNVPGISVAVVTDKDILFSKGYGLADLKLQTPMDPETSLHRPGSNSKILVWTAVMQLMEQGLLDLYADVNTYLDFSIPAKLRSGRETAPITLHHLMTHTAGFEDQVSELFVADSERMGSLAHYVKNNLPARIFVPGAIMSYSNYGTTLAAYIVELVSRQSFADYAEDKIFKPLKMAFSTFRQPIPEELIPNLGEGYRYEAGKYIPGGFEFVQAYPAGSLTSTTHDMAKLMMAQLALGLVNPEITASEDNSAGPIPEVRILQEETAKLMQATQFSSHPEIPGMTYGLIEADYNGHRVLAHGGDTLLFSTGFYFLPEENLGFYVAYNSPLGDEARRSLLEGFMDRYFPDLNAKEPLPKPIAPGTESNYTGIYHNARANFSGFESVLRVIQPVQITIDEDRYLALQTHGNTTYYGEIAPGLFQELHAKDQIAFSFEDGKVAKIHFPGPGTWLRAPWYQSLSFLASLLGLSVLFMLATILGWIRTIFKVNHKRKPFTIPKALGLVFILFLVITLVLLVQMVSNTHPSLGIPTLALAPSSTLKTVLLLTKLLAGLSGFLLITTVYLWSARKGSVWQRVYYSLFSLCALSIILIFWVVRFI